VDALLDPSDAQSLTCAVRKNRSTFPYDALGASSSDQRTSKEGAMKVIKKTIRAPLRLLGFKIVRLTPSVRTHELPTGRQNFRLGRFPSAECSPAVKLG